MSVSGLKAELKFLESIFDKDHERFRIVSWKLDELHCQFVLLPPPPGSSPQPPPPLTIHCNITVRGPSGAGGGGGGPGHGPPSPLSAGRGEGAQPRRGGDSAPGGTGASGTGGAAETPGPASHRGPVPAATVTKVRERAPPASCPRRGGGPAAPCGAPPRVRGKDAGRRAACRRLLRGREPRAGTKGGRARGSGARAPGPSSRRGPVPRDSGRATGGQRRGPPCLPRPCGVSAGHGECFPLCPERWEPGREVEGQRFTECATLPRPGAGRPARTRAGKRRTGGPGWRPGLPPRGGQPAGLRGGRRDGRTFHSCRSGGIK